MSKLFKQLNAVHLLPLPTDMIRVIKSFAFDDRVSYKSKKRKRVMLRTIKNTPYSSNCYLKNGNKNSYYHYFIKEGGFLFWISDDERCPQFLSDFCISCGNYISANNNNNNINEKIRCNCL